VGQVGPEDRVGIVAVAGNQDGADEVDQDLLVGERPAHLFGGDRALRGHHPEDLVLGNEGAVGRFHAPIATPDHKTSRRLAKASAPVGSRLIDRTHPPDVGSDIPEGGLSHQSPLGVDS
jgi:hypothetical protein